MAITQIQKARREELVNMVMEYEPDPGTIGAEIKHAIDEPSPKAAAKAERDKLEWHADRHARWVRLARHRGWSFADESIYTDIVTWELHVCRLRDCREWFAELAPLDRIELCEISRHFRRK